MTKFRSVLVATLVAGCLAWAGGVPALAHDGGDAGTGTTAAEQAAEEQGSNDQSTDSQDPGQADDEQTPADPTDGSEAGSPSIEEPPTGKARSTRVPNPLETVEPTGTTLEVSPASAAPGGSIRVSGSNCLAGSMHLSFDYVISGDETNDDLSFVRALAPKRNGSFTFDLALPPAAAPGAYRVWIMCSAGDAVTGSAETDFTVLGTPPANPPAAVASFIADPLSGFPGDTINVAGTCMFNDAPGDSVAVHWTHAVDGIFVDSTLLAELPIAGDGSLDARVRVPTDAQPIDEGKAPVFGNALSMTCMTAGWEFSDDNIDDESFEYTVLDPSKPQTLANTGTGSPGIGLAAALAAIGIALLAASAHRRKQALR